MKTFFTIGTLAIIIVILVIVFTGKNQSVPVNTQNQIGFPVASSTVNGSGTSAFGTSISQVTNAIAASGTTTVMTKDFLHNGVTLADPSNEGNYYLTGASTDGYAIGFRTPGEFFTIALQQEPLGETRVAAENFLLSTLGVTQDQLCHLKYYLGTDVHTNSYYAGKNLGFSFCPGATVLPK